MTYYLFFHVKHFLVLLTMKGDFQLQRGGFTPFFVNTKLCELFLSTAHEGRILFMNANLQETRCVWEGRARDFLFCHGCARGGHSEKVLGINSTDREDR